MCRRRRGFIRSRGPLPGYGYGGFYGAGFYGGGFYGGFAGPIGYYGRHGGRRFYGAYFDPFYDPFYYPFSPTITRAGEDGFVSTREGDRLPVFGADLLKRDSLYP